MRKVAELFLFASLATILHAARLITEEGNDEQHDYNLHLVESKHQNLSAKARSYVSERLRIRSTEDHGKLILI